MVIKVKNIYTGLFNDWHIPTKDEAIRNSVATWGRRYDRIEREVVEGGIPLLFNKIQG